MGISNFLDSTCERIADGSEKLALRGEVAFERWYFHYQPAAAIKELGQISSRLWAVAYAIESAVKAAIVAISILIYASMGNEREAETRCEVFKTQGTSLLYSLCAIAHPETARDAFKENNTLEGVGSRIISKFRRGNIFPSKYTMYTGDITLRMLINTH